VSDDSKPLVPDEDANDKASGTLADAMAPVAESIYGMTDDQINRALKPLLERIAQLERDVAALKLR